MPIGKIGSTAGKGADYSAGSQNIQHAGKIMVWWCLFTELTIMASFINDRISRCS